MAGMTTRIAQAFAWLGPNKGVTPEDETTPPEAGVLVSRSGESWAVPVSWLGSLIENPDPVLWKSGNGLKLFDELLDDDVAMSNFQQRRLAVISRPWEVEPGDADDPRSVEAADHLRAQLKAIQFDRITNLMLFASWYGYSVAEGLYEVGPDGKWRLADVVVPDRALFGFNGEGALKFRASSGFGAVDIPANKFWVMRTGGSHDFAFYGLGLAHWCYWPIWFKRNVLQFWALYLEKLGQPTVVGQEGTGWSDGDKESFLKALVAIGRDRAVRIPAESLANVKIMETQRSSSGSSGYGEFVTEQNEALMRIILGQPGTSKATAQGIGGAQATVHADDKAEIVKADADLACESFNATFPVWLTRWNFGDDVAPPRVYRVLEDGEDVNSTAERDVKLDGIGIKRTAESVEETYGPGYELAPIAASAVPPIGAAITPGAAHPANGDEGENLAGRRAQFAAQDVAPLYVYRSLKNSAELLKWARGAGLKNLEPASELHVTVLYSRQPVDWFALSDGWAYNSELMVSAGGARKVERLGEEGAIVLRFASDDLEYSHRRKIEAGASHDYAEYLPHVTIAYDPDGELDLEGIEPYVGPLEFGPEMFEALDVDPLPGIELVEFAAGDEDAIAALARTLADETNPLFLEFGAAIRAGLEGVSSPEAARLALLNAFESLSAEKMAALAGLPLVFERMASEAGVER